MIKQRKLTRALESLRSSVAGGAAVELAIVLPVLLLLAIGVADIGRVFFTGITVVNAARAGAQYGAQSTATSADTVGMNLVATQDAADAGAITVSSRSFCRCDAGEIADCSTGDCGVYGLYRLYVEVTATRAVPLVFTYPGFANPVTLTRAATFRVQ